MAILGFSNVVSGLIGGATGAAKTTPVGGGLTGFFNGLTSGSKTASDVASANKDKHKRRRYRPISKSLMSDLAYVEKALGKSAAESYLLRAKR